MSRMRLDSHGRLTLPAEAARQIGGSDLELTSHSARHLLLTVPVAEGRVALAGVLGEVAVADLLSFLHMFRKTGVLHLALAGGGKDLYFQDGDIAFAASTFPEEDLGEILFAQGKVDREVLRQTRRTVSAAGSVGKTLVEKNLLAPRDLWLATRLQVETIVYALFSQQRGSFAFVVKDLAGEDIPRLSLSAQNLIMEGLRRMDERALYMRHIPTLDAVPKLDEAAGPGQTPAEQRLLDLARTGIGSVRELLRRSGLGELEALRMVHHLAERGWLLMAEPPRVEVEGESGEILAICNGALAAIARRLAGKAPSFRQELRLFLRDLPQPFSLVFRDVDLLEDGSVEGWRILANLAKLEDEDRKKLLVDALSELLFMACLAARRELGSGESAELIRRVQEITRRIGQLAGRTE